MPIHGTVVNPAPLTMFAIYSLGAPLEAPMPDDDLPFKVVRTNDEVLARAANLLVGRAAYETARRLYPRDRIDYRHGARVIERSDGES
jgi:hypothetical protein